MSEPPEPPLDPPLTIPYQVKPFTNVPLPSSDIILCPLKCIFKEKRCTDGGQNIFVT